MGAGPKTVALMFIAKTDDMAKKMVDDWGRYFDGCEYIVGVIEDSFSDQRNKVLDKVIEKGYDYAMWFDTDDEVVGLENLRQLVSIMAERGVHALYLPYEYAFNEQGECIVLQWRERIINVAHPFRWMGAIHESLISTSKPLLDRSEDMVVRHDKTVQSHHESAARNHAILLKEYKKPQRDPRITHYLALSFFNLNQYNKAIKLFHEHIRTSGWDEDQYRSWFYIGQAHGLQGDNKKVLEAAIAAMALIPPRPEAYVLAATAEFEMGNMGKCLEWLKVAGGKEAPKNSLSAIDPTYYTYKAEFLAAQAYLRLGQIKEAHDQMKVVLQHSPNFPAARELAPLFDEIYNDQVAVTRINWLAQYITHYGGKAHKLLESIPPRLMSDPRLNDTRLLVTPPQKWPDKSIVFFCGQAAEQWGPDTISNGIGGSEEAIIYLSRELTKVGYSVTIFNDREDEYLDPVGPKAVRYKPWALFNPRDEFDTVVAWRNPAFFTTLGIKAKRKLVDMHDMAIGHQEIEEKYAKDADVFMFKSEFQRSQLRLPAGKSAVVSNGLVKKQFDKKVKRRKHSVGYYSSYDRGLPCLLHLWPRIRKEVPDATLDIYYGWNSFDQMHQNNPEQMKFKWALIRDLAKLKNQGVKEHGRVSHEELAESMLGTEVWAYPTQFPEINCITALKTGLAGQIQVTSGYAALQETVHEKQPNYDETVYTDKHNQDDFVERLVKALKEGRSEEERNAYATNYAKYDWSEIAKGWDKVIKDR